MAFRSLPANTSQSSFVFGPGQPSGFATIPASLGSGNYIFYADGTIWDATNNIVIKPEQTNQPRLFVDPPGPPST